MQQRRFIGIMALAMLVPLAAAAQDTVDATVTGADCHITATTHTTTVDVTFNRTDATQALGASVTFTLSGDVDLGPAGITQGTWLTALPNTFQTFTADSTTYTVDQVILGPSNCGITTGGQLFTVALQATATEGTGTLTITSVTVRDCSNQTIAGAAGSAATVDIDQVPPAAIADLATTQVKTGNDDDGTTQITVDFTDPPDPDLASVEVWRKGFGAYPEYDDDGGTTPTTPADPAAALADGWTLTAVTATGQTDEPATRDFWYYVAFSTDDCGNVSAVSNQTDGTLNYHLGDVHNGSANCAGDNFVNTLNDISFLGANYGETGLPTGDPVNCLDVGPTSDASVDGLPQTDDNINFEDLVIFALNHGEVGLTGTPEAIAQTAGHPRLELVVEPMADGRLRARLLLADHRSGLKAIHAIVQLENARLVEVDPGALLDEQAGEVFFTHLPEGGTGIHTAILGRRTTFAGEGEVASLVLEGGRDATATLVFADLRDLQNRPLGDAPQAAAIAAGDPARSAARAGLELLGAEPNPFNPQTTIRFRLDQAAPVAVRIHDVAGRLLRTLADESMAAGEHAVTWDGRDSRGQRIGSGVYFVAVEAGGYEAVERLVLVK